VLQLVIRQNTEQFEFVICRPIKARLGACLPGILQSDEVTLAYVGLSTILYVLCCSGAAC
jgi:hypothetical protein